MMKLIISLKDGTKQEYSLEDSVFAVKLSTNNASTVEGCTNLDAPIFVLQICSLEYLSFIEKQLFYKVYTEIFSLIKKDSILKFQALLSETDEIIFDSEILNIKPISISIMDELGRKNFYDNTTISINLLFQ